MVIWLLLLVVENWNYFCRPRVVGRSPVLSVKTTRASLQTVGA